MAVTIKQIAAVAGVSRGTVDRVLHDRAGVNSEIAAHVRSIAGMLGYAPNRAGKMLASRKQPLKIGCFLPRVGNSFFDDVLAGFRRAEAEYADFGVTVELREVEGYDVQTHVRAIDELVEAGCQALCVSTIDVPATRTYINQLADTGIPVVAVNTDLTGTKRLCYIGCDYARDGETAAGLLALMARQKPLNLLIVTGSLKMKGHNQRVQSFLQTLRVKGVSYRLADMFESLDHDAHAFEMTQKAFAAHVGINCIYIVAAGVAGVCRAVAGQKPAERPYVLCYDETAAIRRLVYDGMIDFTIGQEAEQQGYCAVQLLFEYFMHDKKIAPQDVITGSVIKIKENLGKATAPSPAG